MIALHRKLIHNGRRNSIGGPWLRLTDFKASHARYTDRKGRMDDENESSLGSARQCLPDVGKSQATNKLSCKIHDVGILKRQVFPCISRIPLGRTMPTR